MAVTNIPPTLPIRPGTDHFDSSNDKIRKFIPPTSDRVDRASFSSIKENRTGEAQSFTDSKTSSYLRSQPSGTYRVEEAIDDTSSSGIVTPPNGGKVMLPLTNPHSSLHGFVCPCEGFKGWKQISLRGKTVSKSSGDLRSLTGGWDWEMRTDVFHQDAETVKGQRCAPGEAHLESLPMELLGSIIDQLAIDIPPNGFTARNVDLMSLLLTSRSLHAATLATLYNHITIPHSRIFRKFLSHVAEHPSLGTIVRRLDFSHFNPTGIGLTARERAQTQNLTPTTLTQCLSLTPNLREFLAQEHIDDELDEKVLAKLFFDLHKIKALDFCACSSSSFRNAFTSILSSPLPASFSITRLSLHECAILPSSVYDSLLPRLPHLTHLDVAHTRITESALFSIPLTARLTHLNLSKCGYLTGSSVVEFLSTHPSISTLVYLNLMVDVKSHEMLSSAEITTLLSPGILPSSLRSLNLKGSKMSSDHIPLLLPFTKHLEELGLGRHLDLASICRLFIPDENLSLQEQLEWVPHNLRYIDISDLSALTLDLGTLFSNSCPLLKALTRPLEVFELSTDVYGKLEKGGASAMKRVGWCLKDAGRRGWLVRQSEEGEKVDGGGREWKWGANYWGMRKVPVARAEVGGMYGLYMFKR